MAPTTAGILTASACLLPFVSLVVSRCMGSEHKLFREARLAHSAESRSWAFITGSSGGIGYGTAFALCRNGFNVIIHGRNEDRLEEAVKTLRKAFPQVLVESFCFNASIGVAKDDLTDDVKDILTSLKARNIRILVNNVGTGFSPDNKHDFAPFTAHSRQHIAEVIDVNIRFNTYLTWYFLKQLEDNARRAGNHSIVLNISSVSDIGIPWLATYSASKAYITCFTKALDTEMKAEGIPIDVKTTIPGSVDSPNCRIGVSFTCPSSDQMGREVVETIKNVRSAIVTYPNWGHWIQTVFCAIQPYWLLQKMLIAGVTPTVSYRKEGKC